MQNFGAAAARGLAAILLFPWGIWSAIALLPRTLHARLPEQGSARAACRALHVVLYLCIGVPLTAVIFVETLISANEWIIGEQANYRLQSDLAAGTANVRFELPGALPAEPAISLAPGADREAHLQALVARFSPVVVQKVAHHPEWDLPLALDFDGNGEPRDNVDNLASFDTHRAVVYGEVTAETGDSYYLTYSLYHVKDYDHPVRELLTDWTYHDNDNEGFMIRLDRQTLEVEQVETWFHNRFLLYDRSGESRGTEPIHGAIHLEGGTHPIIYVQSQGHGVRLFQSLDLESAKSSAKILRHRGDRPLVRARADRSVQTDLTYELASFDPWYALARGPIGHDGIGPGLFEGTILLGKDAAGQEIRIGRFIGGRDYSKIGLARPKPPWSWDDGWDDVPVFAWHFFPSLAFASHSGRQLSDVYRYNRPVEKTFRVAAKDLAPLLTLPKMKRSSDKWEVQEHGQTPDRRSYWKAFELGLKRYVNYVFHALG